MKVSLKRKGEEGAETGDLKRFAGSSDKEENDHDDIEETDEIDNQADKVDELAGDDNEIGYDDECEGVVEEVDEHDG